MNVKLNKATAYTYIRLKYGKGTNKGTLKVRRKFCNFTVKICLHSTELE